MDIKTLIEKYYEATITAEEERCLYDYLHNNDVPQSMANDKELILAMCPDVLSADRSCGFEQRISDFISELDTKENEANKNGRRLVAVRRRFLGLPFKFWTVSAAAFIGVIAGFAALSTTEPKETFDSPEEAYACVSAIMSNIALVLDNGVENIRRVGVHMHEAQAVVNETCNIIIE